MEQVHMIGIDLAKQGFQLHGARPDGSVAFRKKLTRGKVLGFLASQPRCEVAMEACGSAHYWGREIGELGHEVKIMPPAYVKPFVKRHKNDEADAEAICEAVSRPAMRFVAVKTEEQQSRGMLFRTRDLMVRQRTQTSNALRGHLAEFGVIAPKGPAHVARLASAVADPDSVLPETVREPGGLLLGQIAGLNRKVGELESRIRAGAYEDEEARRLMSIPGIGPICASAILAFASPMEHPCSLSSGFWGFFQRPQKVFPSLCKGYPQAGKGHTAPPRWWRPGRHEDGAAASGRSDQMRRSRISALAVIMRRHITATSATL